MAFVFINIFYYICNIMLMTMEYDKINGDVAFRESDHKYFNVKYPDRVYTSVTTLIGKYHEKFDGDFWSSYKALEALTGVDFVRSKLKFRLLETKKIEDIQVILDEFLIEREDFDKKKEMILLSYKVANEEACARGTDYHAIKENRFYTQNQFAMKDFDDFKLDLSGVFACEKHNFDLNRDNAILPEYLVYYSDGVVNLAGQMDVLVKNGNDIYILDYKTNAKGMETKAYFDAKKKKTKRMFYPLNDIDDCMINHYTLQLSIYAWMLKQINPEFNIKLLRLLHIDGEGVETDYDVPYLESHVERLIADYRRQVVVEHYRNTGVMLGE